MARDADGSMPRDCAGEWRARLRRDLRSAMRKKSAREISVLRGLIAAIDNAQAPPADDRHQRHAMRKFGDGSAEVSRIALGSAQVRSILQREVELRRLAASEFERLGKIHNAEICRAEAEVAQRYLVDSSREPS